MHWELANTEEREGFTVKLYTAPEEDSPRGHFDSGDKEADEEIFRKIDQGVYIWFIAKVEASKAGVVLGTDYLGGNCYESVADFMEPGGYYPDMVAEAIRAAKAKLVELAK